MAYILRFTETYMPAHHQAVLELDFPQGRRYQPRASGEPNHSLVWECEWSSLVAVQEALKVIEADPTHTDLFSKQSPTLRICGRKFSRLLSFNDGIQRDTAE